MIADHQISQQIKCILWYIVGSVPCSLIMLSHRAWNKWRLHMYVSIAVFLGGGGGAVCVRGGVGVGGGGWIYTDKAASH